MRTKTRYSKKTSLSCRQLGKVLQTYLDGEIDEHTAQLVAGHLEKCKQCGLEAHTYEALISSLQTGLVDDESGAALERLASFGHRLAAGEVV